MTKETELQGIDQTIEQLREAAERIAGLLGILKSKKLEMEPTPEIIATELDLERTARLIQTLAHGLEGALEKQDHDRYLEWLLTIPADSALFEARKTSTDQHRINLP
jgi:hypothetical protein